MNWKKEKIVSAMDNEINEKYLFNDLSAVK